MFRNERLLRCLAPATIFLGAALTAAAQAPIAPPEPAQRPDGVLQAAATTAVSASDQGQMSSDTAAAATPTVATPGQPAAERYVDVYGFAMLDMGYDFNSTNPDWFDVSRPSKLPSFAGEFGRNGNTYFSVRQSRLGVQGTEPTAWGQLTVKFEFDMFGVGADAGQTTIRPRHYYGEIGQFLAGQTNSVFMDIDVFPNIVEYWGPNGMVFLRNPQFRWTPIKGKSTVEIALEKPGQSGDAGTIADRVEVQNLTARFQFPDVTGAYKYDWVEGYGRVAAIVRNVKLDNPANNPLNLNQSITGWGVDFSSNLKFRKDVLRLQYVIGEGIENYMNDAPIDVAAASNANPLRPFKGKAVPMDSFVAYLDYGWTDKWTTSLGYSQLEMENTDLQLPNAFHRGQYASINLLHSPFNHFLYGGEFQWARRTNFADGFHSHDYRLQFSFKYNFDARIKG